MSHTVSTSSGQAGVSVSGSTEDKRPSGVMHALGVGLSAGLLGLVVLLALVTVVIPKVTGSMPLAILTSSMEPSLPPGTLIIVRPTPPEDVHVGDVVTYQIRSGDPAVVSHRVIEIIDSSARGRTFITQGDNNARPDVEMVPEQLRGVVWYSVPYLGWVSTYVHGNPQSWVIPGVAVLLLVYAAYMLTSGLMELRRKRSAAIAGAWSAPRRAAPDADSSNTPQQQPNREAGDAVSVGITAAGPRRAAVEPCSVRS